MSATAVARSVLRSTARLTSGLRPRAGINSTFSPLRIPQQNALFRRILRVPVVMSCGVETMFPYHTATASALLTSMLSVSPRSYGWTSDDCNDDV